MAKPAHHRRTWAIALLALTSMPGTARLAEPAAAQAIGKRELAVREPVYAPRKAATRAPQLARTKAATKTKMAPAKPVVAAVARPTKAEAQPAAAPSSTPATDAPNKAGPPVAEVPMTMDGFLDRLMIAESGGRLDARNPRSTAVGPFQFIESTFLAVARRNFAAEIADKSSEQILALRTDMAFSRKAAEAYTRENAAVLKSYDVEPTYPNLRLAFLLGPAGASKVLKAPPLTPLSSLLSPAVLVANPFMVTLTASGLAARSAREVWQPVNTTQGVLVPPGTALPRRIASSPVVPVQCNLRLPSCKRWLALQTAKVRGKRPVAVDPAAGQKLANARSQLGAPKAAPKR